MQQRRPAARGGLARRDVAGTTGSKAGRLDGKQGRLKLGEDGVLRRDARSRRLRGSSWGCPWWPATLVDGGHVRAGKTSSGHHCSWLGSETPWRDERELRSGTAGRLHGFGGGRGSPGRTLLRRLTLGGAAPDPPWIEAREEGRRRGAAYSSSRVREALRVGRCSARWYSGRGSREEEVAGLGGSRGGECWTGAENEGVGRDRLGMGGWIWEDPDGDGEWVAAERRGILGSWSRVCPNRHVGGLFI